MKDRERKKKKVVWAQKEMSHVIRHHEPWYAKMNRSRWSIDRVCCRCVNLSL